MKTMTIKKNAGSKLSPGWKILEITKAAYGDWQGKKYLDLWFKDLPESCNARVYAASGKDGEEFAIAQVFRFAEGAGLSEALTSANGDMVVQFDDTADNLVGKHLWTYMYKDGEYSRVLKQFAPIPFNNQIEEFTEADTDYWKSRANKYYEEYVKKDTGSNGFISDQGTIETSETITTSTDDVNAPKSDAEIPF